MNYSSELGKLSEEKAAEYLFKLGYKILGRNFKNKFGEIDIIALEKSENMNPELVIVEVRARVIGEIQTPVDTVGNIKLRKIIRTSRALIEELNWQYFWRIDIIGITFKKQLTIQELKNENNIDFEIEHIKDATYGMNIFS